MSKTTIALKLFASLRLKPKEPATQANFLLEVVAYHVKLL
jgi:hypothetical protein